MQITFPAAKAKFVRITQTGTLAPDHGSVLVRSTNCNFCSREARFNRAWRRPAANANTAVVTSAGQAGRPGENGSVAPRHRAGQAAHPRNILVYGNANGFVHSSIPLGEQTVAALGTKTGAWTATISNDPAVFDDLKKYDAIVLVSTTGRFLIPNGICRKIPRQNSRQAFEAGRVPYKEAESQRMQNLLDFVQKDGKGLAGIHAATDAYKELPAYGDLIGGYFNGHPWNEKVGIKLDDPDSPLTQMFDKTGFRRRRRNLPVHSHAQRRRGRTSNPTRAPTNMCC